MTCLAYSSESNAVLLQDISAMTFSKGTYTHTIRTRSRPQLKCVGGGACQRSYKVTAVQCHNMGTCRCKLEM